MSKARIEVSDYGREINANVVKQMEARRISGRELAGLIRRSVTYVMSRINEEQEWAPSDIERMAEVWNIPKFMLTDKDASEKGDAYVRTMSDEELTQAVMSKILSGDVSLVANRDPHKYEEMEGGDGR